MTFTGQRKNSWTQDPRTGPYIEVSHEKAIEELEEIPVERNTNEDLQRTPAMHTRYKRLLGQINWLRLLQVLQMCLNGSFSNSGRCECEGSQQTGETQVTAKESSVLATHRTI